MNHPSKKIKVSHATSTNDHVHIPIELRSNILSFIFSLDELNKFYICPSLEQSFTEEQKQKFLWGLQFRLIDHDWKLATDQKINELNDELTLKRPNSTLKYRFLEGSDFYHSRLFSDNRLYGMNLYPKRINAILCMSNHGSAYSILKHQPEYLSLEIVRRNPMSLEHIRNQTHEMCRIAVSQYPPAIQYVTNKTDDLIELALKKEGKCLMYILRKEERWCVMAVEQDEKSIMHIDYPSEQVAWIALKRDPATIIHVTDQTPEMVDYCLGKNPLLYVHIKQPSNEMLIDCIRREPTVIRYARIQTDEMQDAFMHDPMNYVIEGWKPMNSGMLKFKTHKDHELFMKKHYQRFNEAFNPQNTSHWQKLLTHNGHLLCNMQQSGIPQTRDLVLTAVKNNPVALKHSLIQQDEEICKIAVSKDSSLLEIIKDPTDDVLLAALSGNRSLFDVDFVDRYNLDTEEGSVLLAKCLRNNVLKPEDVSGMECYPLLLSVVLETYPDELEDLHVEDYDILKMYAKIHPDKIHILGNVCMSQGIDPCELIVISIGVHGRLIQFFHDQTREMCIAALNQDPFNLCFIHTQTEELCEIAMRKDYRSFMYVKHRTQRLCDLYRQMKNKQEQQQ